MITKMSFMRSKPYVRAVINLNKLKIPNSNRKIKKNTKKSPIKIKFKSNSKNLITNSKTKKSSDFNFFLFLFLT